MGHSRVAISSHAPRVVTRPPLHVRLGSNWCPFHRRLALRLHALASRSWLLLDRPHGTPCEGIPAQWCTSGAPTAAPARSYQRWLGQGRLLACHRVLGRRACLWLLGSCERA